MQVRIPQLPSIPRLQGFGDVENALRGLIDYIGRLGGEIVRGTQPVAFETATPTPMEGQWWVEVVGTTPNRVAAIKVRDGGVTRTIASLTY